jgi:DNA-binding NarL/FixJ family response regulator
MRILVADRQSKVRYALRVLLGQQAGMEVVGEAASVMDLLAQAEAVHPDLVLLHWRLEGPPVADLLPALRKIQPDVKVIVLSARPEVCPATVSAGADGFVSKVDPPDRLLAAIRAVMPSDGQDLATSGSWQPRPAAVLERRDRRVQHPSLGPKTPLLAAGSGGG